jgi:hypothetical protein
MKIKTHISLFILLLFFLSTCQGHSEQQKNQSVEIDSLSINDLETVVSTESELLGEPREIVSLDEQHLAVYDHGFKKIIVFNNEGNKQYEFGSIGEGPGEWDTMSGAADLEYLDEQFFTTNRSRFLFDLYDKEGNHLKSLPFPQYLKYSHKILLPANKLLVSTDGNENALAAILDLNEDGNIIQKIGSPESEYSEGRNLEQERITYSNGEIPKNALNEALVAGGQDGYFLFMNAMGELRHYSKDGELIMKQKIPANIKESRFDHVVTQNREEAKKHTVMTLKYAQEMKIHNEQIYLFMPKPHPSVEDLDFRMLVYNTKGNLLKHYVFTDSKQESFLYNFMINNNKVYFIDVMKAQILRLP